MNVLDIYKKAAAELTATGIKLDKDQSYKNEIAISYCAIHAPLFSNLLYSAMKLIFTDQVAVAATDEISIFMNPKTFLVNYDADEQAYIYAHEIMHRIRRDCSIGHKLAEIGQITCPGGALPFDHQVHNIACDYIINAELVNGKVGRKPKDALYDRDISDGSEDTAVVYERVYKQGQSGRKGKPGQGQGTPAPGQGRCQPGPGQFDEHLAPGSASGQKPDERAEDKDDDFKLAVAAAAQAAKLIGKLPGNLLRLINKVLADEIPWQDVLRTTLMRVTSTGSWDWRRPDRRLIARPERIYAPRRTGFDAGHVVIGIDVSGSIGQRELDQIMAQTALMMDCVNPEQLSLVWCDTHVRQVDEEVEDHDDLNRIRAKGSPGGGGTNMNPIIAEVKKRGWTPEALVIFTDLHITPMEGVPPYHVIWAATTDMPHPYGDHVRVKVR